MIPGVDNDMASDVTNGNSNIAESLTNNNLTAGTVETAAKMKRQSSLQSSSSPPAVSRDRTGSEADANMTSLSGSYPGSTSTTTQSTPIHSANTVPTIGSPFRLMREESVDGTLSPVSFKGGMDTLDNDTSGRRKRHPTDKAYFIAKEILMTERTYKKDLEVINLWFRDEVSKEEDMPDELLALLFAHIDPIYELHCGFLKDIEQRMAAWEGRGGGQANGHGDSSSKRISDIVMKTFDATTTERYLKYVEAHTLILESLESALASEKDVKFAQVVRDFE